MVSPLPSVISLTYVLRNPLGGTSSPLKEDCFFQGSLSISLFLWPPEKLQGPVLFFFFLAALGLLLLCVSFSSCWELGLLLAVEWRLLNCSGFSCYGAQTLATWISVMVTHGLSCSAACGIFPDQGLNPGPCISRQILTHCTTREVQACHFWVHRMKHILLGWVSLETKVP